VRRLKTLFLAGGLALSAWIVAEVGASSVGSAVRPAGWSGLLILASVHLVATGLMGIACWQLRRLGGRWVFIWARLVRDGGSEVLPLSQIGGYVLGARALAIHGVNGTVATASVVVDATLEFGAQIAFAALGLFLLVWLLPNSTLALPLLAGIAVAVAVIVACLAVPRSRISLRLGHRFLDATMAAAAATQGEIRQIYRGKAAVCCSFLLHLAAWMYTGFEAWIALRLMGASLSPLALVTIESLIYAARAAAFLVPNAIGVQEGAYIILGASLGLTPEFALGLSLLKRGRDLVLGIPALISWQVFEIRQHRILRASAGGGKADGRDAA
jgi:glycosyltransferase 2 family protein